MHPLVAHRQADVVVLAGVVERSAHPNRETYAGSVGNDAAARSDSLISTISRLPEDRLQREVKRAEDLEPPR
jgi:hypothetical protein